MPFPAKTSTDAIIQSAADIIRSGGLTSLSMRSLASRLGVRASSLYRHFPDRSAIERTLADRAAKKLLECMEEASQNLTGDRALFAAGRAYLDYASAEASFYDILIQCSTPTQQTSQIAQPIWNYFVRITSQATQREQDTSGAAALWSFLHGFTILSRSGQFGEAALKPAFVRGVQALIRGLSLPDADAVGSPV